MGIIDTVKRAMHGRSAMVEKVIDGAVELVGKYSETLKEQGEGLKDKARRLDEGRAADVAGPTTTGTATVADAVVDAAAGAGTLRGDLAPKPPPAPPVVGELPSA